MGRVYLARDLTLGRSVALKIVGTSRSGALDEALTIARLSHPNIVMLYDVGEYRGGLYFALEYVDGETMRAHMERGPIAAAEALRHVRAIADALDHAHALGIVHCDLKPGNILFGKDGRLRVVDFGLARTRDDPMSIGGTPTWMAPEQAQRGKAEPATDIWALGIITARLLSPAADPRSLDGVTAPAAIMRLLRQSLSDDPKFRPSAAQWRTAIDQLSHGEREDDDEGPFPGLAAFDERHAHVFFGRESALDEIVERMRESPFLPIVGPTGVGKSSFLLAGIVPRLRSTEAWTVVAFRPGSDPIGALARQTAIVLDQPDDAADLRNMFLETPALVAARLETIAAATKQRVLVVIDQLEEVFTHGCAAAEREAFLEMLRCTADDPSDAIRMIATIRDDFVGQLAGVRALFVLPKLSAADLQRVITKPLERYAVTIDDPTLVDDLVSELEHADLPMLQFACRTLWEGRDREARKIRRTTHDEMGGVKGALARHAERAMSQLSPGERACARVLLLQLVSGTSRRAVPRVQLLAATADPEIAIRVVDQLIATRLVVQRSNDDGIAFVEIAHESLLENWVQLARWIDESRDERRVLDDLEAATALWERRGRRDEETWAAKEIDVIRHRLRGIVRLPERVEAFLVAGEHRARQKRRRRLIGYGIALATVVGVAIPATIMIERYLARERLIRENAGTVDFVLRPFDSHGGVPVPASVSELPNLSWALHEATNGDPHVPGDRITYATALSVTRTAKDITIRVRAPGGLAFLAITGRGRAGESCAPSWIRIQWFPGYVAGVVERMTIDFPTCRASQDDMIPVPEGDFIYGGPGDPPSERYGRENDYTRPEQLVKLPTFELDRTEVSNAAFAPFTRIANITGYPAPVYSREAIHAHDGDATSPVTYIDSFQAAAFCRFMGKELPTDQQWVKAARGDVMAPTNTMPRRTYPWGNVRDPTRVNQAGDGDPYRWVAPVDAFEESAGPYGHLNLVGNVNEWTATKSEGLSVIRGGAADSPPELDHTSTVFINKRNPLAFNYSIGVRCARPSEKEQR
jgi:hypothetical protein